MTQSSISDAHRFPSQRKIVSSKIKWPHITAQQNPPLYTETIKSCYPKMASTLAAEQKPNSPKNKPLEAP